MKSLIALALMALFSAPALAFEGKCYEMRKGEKGMVSVPVACKEHPIPCSESRFDGKSTHITTVPCKPGQQKTLEQVEREKEAVQKRKCGKDFRALRIGMTLDRFEDCYEALRYMTETVNASGTIETYRSTFYWIHAQDGRIVSFTRR